jgi:hypothetical protein
MFEELKSAEGTTIMHWVCDEGCGAVAEFESDSFHAAWAELKARRWKGVKPGYTAQLGSMKGTHLTDGRDAPASKALIAKDAKTLAGGNQRLGNECTEPCGPKGQGRVLYGKSGTNHQYGAANPGERSVQGPDPLSPWFGSNNAARRSPVKR